MDWQLIIHDFLEDMAEELLHEGEHIIALDKAHLQVELGELKLTVAAGILIAVTACDLEVLVHSSDHQNLLEELGALGKGIELSGIDAAGNQKVTGALGGALDHGRGLNLVEVLRGKVLAAGEDEVMA
ncbi:hypothetical protein SDC9_127368 [bioreactor metagenome]|uniref:Uncharacterized protein n=1 Tax=bioreactor metagenome TaxID=1076179 RepID=A0A645CTT6_9ZZZZ